MIDAKMNLKSLKLIAYHLEINFQYQMDAVLTLLCTCDLSKNSCETFFTNFSMPNKTIIFIAIVAKHVYFFFYAKHIY
ncbi:hypothetical protein KFK09_015366 [Dendrobium nobile]|uniref:Uncharacterized protein n=1 Tax=Dendrobium nobile TaxID=94219 RepID=A0A8T3B4L1_DENNO|nr:hypothetical protein KFK09_015366 [Dendrobium nobile]